MTLKEKIIYDSLTVSRTHVNVYKVYAAAVRSSGLQKTAFEGSQFRLLLVLRIHIQTAETNCGD
jgi:hypothetical protein